MTDALDELIGDERIDPQLAMKVLTQFDRIIAETLQEKVKARLTFKVISFLDVGLEAGGGGCVLPPARGGRWRLTRHSRYAGFQPQ